MWLIYFVPELVSMSNCSAQLRMLKLRTKMHCAEKHVEWCMGIVTI
jgi:hypothetical protein